MKKTAILASIAGLAMTVLPFGALAQDDDADAVPPLSDVWVMVVKPGMDDEFNAAVATHLKFRKDAGESRAWNAYRVAAGHNMKPVAFRSCCFNWADLDTHAAETEELGLREHFAANVAQYVDHLHHYLERADIENSHWPDEGTNGPYYSVTTWKVKEGAGPEVREARARISQLALDGDWADGEINWLWFSREIGDAEISLVSSYENYAAMEPPEPSFYEFIVEEIGQEEADAVFADFSSGFADSDHTIWVHDPDISTPQDDDD